MVEYSDPLDSAFGALSDPTRRSILARLACGEASVTELAAPYEMSLNAVSKHLKVLESAGLLQRRIDGRMHYCSLAPQGLSAVAEWLDHYRSFWEERLEALESFLIKKKGARHGRTGNKVRSPAPDSKSSSRKRG